MTTLLAACGDSEVPVGAVGQALVRSVVEIGNDQTAQNETPIAVNPRDSSNLIVGANDWNYNDGCGVNASLDGGKTWTPTLPNGFLPGVTRFTNDPSVPGTGAYDAGGDPQIAFGPDGTAYYVCQAFNFTSPYEIALLVSRSTDGGVTWLDGATRPLTRIATWNGNGKNKGSNGQFPDHESIHIDNHPGSPFYGSIYVTWVQFDGNSSHSPVLVAASRDGGRTFGAAVKVTAGPIRNNQDARLSSGPDGALYLTFDNGLQGGKGLAIFAAASRDGGATWSSPVTVAVLNNPVCTFPGYCFNLSGGPFRSGGSYPASAYDATRGRLFVSWPDIVDGVAQIFLTSASGATLADWTAPVVVAPNQAGDRFQLEMSVAANGRLDFSFYDRGYSGNTLVDVTYVSSSDGGRTFSAQRVTPAGFDPAQWGVPAASGLRPFIGDYNGLVSLDRSAVLAWTGAGSTIGDPPYSNLDIFFASVTP